MKKKKVLFCHTGMSSFVQTDYDLLSEQYEVKQYQYAPAQTKMMKLKNIISSFFFALFWVREVDVVFVWFGGYHGFFPVLFANLFRKKSIIIVGGYDASYVPSISYGVFFKKGFLLWCVKRIYNWATYICPVDESLVHSTNYYADPTGEGYPTGILNHMDIDIEKISVIHLGFKPIKRIAFPSKEHFVLSVMYIDDYEQFNCRGGQLIFDCADLMKDVHFKIVGVSPSEINRLEKLKPKNVSLYPPTIDLGYHYERAKILFHPSLREGFCSVLVEAMIYGCIPIGSDVGGIRRSIGECGYVLESQDIQKTVAYLNLGLNNNSFENLARIRAFELYNLDLRKTKLLNII